MSVHSLNKSAVFEFVVLLLTSVPWRALALLNLKAAEALSMDVTSQLKEQMLFYIFLYSH